ncbi:MAG: hypothetical protein K2Q18_07695, partial [Bdellovibrionales bacterium]|nr:hypothetical protein [Bdellovibrionales bacterium]
MAKFKLIPYQSDSAPKIHIESELNTTPSSLYISYKVTGDLGSIDLGEGHPKHARVIKLWEKSCFELFIKNEKDNYIEFNFSPEFEWNAFYFPKKGDPLTEYARVDSVKTDILLSLEVFHLIIEIDKKKFPADFFGEASGNLTAAITSVIKE